MSNKLESMSAFWWRKRQPSVEESVESIYEFLLLLKRHNPDLFAFWYESAYSKEKAMEQKVDITPEYIRKKLHKNKDKLFDDLGSSMSLWTGHGDDDLAGSINFRIGGYGEKPFNKNSCVLSLPAKSDFYELSENRENLYKLMLGYWHPNEILVNGETYP